jgi:hypothetical protein
VENNDIIFQLVKYQDLNAQLAIECFQRPQYSALWKVTRYSEIKQKTNRLDLNMGEAHIATVS